VGHLRPPKRSRAQSLLDSLFFRIEEARSLGPSSRDDAQKILEWLDGMDPDRRHRDFLTKELRWSVTGPDRIADIDYSVHEALLDLLERSNSATTKRLGDAAKRSRRQFTARRV